MQFHKSLKILVENISKLQFSTQHEMKPTPFLEHESTFDVLTRTSCNGMFTEEFKTHLQNIISEIVKRTNDNLIALGTHFQREILEIIIHTDRIQNYYFQNEKYQGIEETILGFDLFKNEMYELGMIDYGIIETRIEPKEEFYMIVTNQLELLKSELSEFLFNNKQEIKPIKKLKWNIKPAVLAGLMHELIEKDWISPPRKPNKVNWSGFGRELNEIFEYQGESISLYNALKTEFPLSDENRREIELPPSNYFK